MARTTPSTTPPDNTDTASDVLTGLALAAWHVLRWSVIVTWWAVLFPMVAFPAVLTAWAWIAYGWQAGIAAALLPGATDVSVVVSIDTTRGTYTLTMRRIADDGNTHNAPWLVDEIAYPEGTH